MSDNKNDGRYRAELMGPITFSHPKGINGPIERWVSAQVRVRMGKFEVHRGGGYAKVCDTVAITPERIRMVKKEAVKLLVNKLNREYTIDRDEMQKRVDEVGLL